MVKSRVSNNSNRSNQSTAKTAASNPKAKSKAPNTQLSDLDIDDIDPELLSDSYNQVRRPLLPYGIVVNDKPAGLLIPEDQLEKAGWLDIPDENDLTIVTLTEDVTGLLITQARLLVVCQGNFAG
jgi:Family of unknown function (DUF5895)